jgi:hypothetical protein
VVGESSQRSISAVKSLPVAVHERHELGAVDLLV